MNARSQLLELELEPRQVEEGILCLFHSVLFHRTTGKFSYKDSCSYHINALGYEDVDCDYIDHTYVRDTRGIFETPVLHRYSPYYTDHDAHCITLVHRLEVSFCRLFSIILF